MSELGLAGFGSIRGARLHTQAPAHNPPSGQRAPP